MREEKYVDLEELLRIFDTNSGTVARHLDYDDGNYDGYIEIGVWNNWLEKHGFEPVRDVDKVPVMDAIVVLESLKK
ncbi:MAG: hypothetical protein MJ231_00570 [bacterium]|nr:hypothetical protein [bacterium]